MLLLQVAIVPNAIVMNPTFLRDTTKYVNQSTDGSGAERLSRLGALDQLVIDTTQNEMRRTEQEYKPASRKQMVQQIVWLEEKNIVHGAKLADLGLPSFEQFAKSCQLAVAHACQPGCSIGPKSTVFARIRTMATGIHDQLQKFVPKNSAQSGPLKDAQELSPDDRMILAAVGALRTLTAHPTESQLAEANEYCRKAGYATPEHSGRQAPAAAATGAANGESGSVGLKLKHRFKVPFDIADACRAEWLHSMSTDCQTALSNPSVDAYVKACHLLGADAVVHVACEAVRSMLPHGMQASDGSTWCLAAMRSAVLNISKTHSTVLAETLALPTWMSEYKGYSIDTESAHFGYSVSAFPDSQGELVNLGLQGLRKFNPKRVSPWLQREILSAVVKTCETLFSAARTNINLQLLDEDEHAAACAENSPLLERFSEEDMAECAEFKKMAGILTRWGAVHTKPTALGTVRDQVVDLNRMKIWSKPLPSDLKPDTAEFAATVCPTMHRMAAAAEWTAAGVLQQPSFGELVEAMNTAPEDVFPLAVDCHISSADIPDGGQHIQAGRLRHDAMLSTMCIFLIRECKDDTAKLYSMLQQRSESNIGALLKKCPRPHHDPSEFSDLFSGSKATVFIVESVKQGVQQHIKKVLQAIQRCSALFAVDSFSSDAKEAVCMLLMHSAVSPAALKAALLVQEGLFAGFADSAKKKVDIAHDQCLQELQLLSAADSTNPQWESELRAVCQQVQDDCTGCADELSRSMAVFLQNPCICPRSVFLAGAKQGEAGKALKLMQTSMKKAVAAAAEDVESACSHMACVQRLTLLDGKHLTITKHVADRRKKIHPDWSRILVKPPTKLPSFAFCTAAHAAALNGAVDSLVQLQQVGANIDRLLKRTGPTDDAATTYWNVLALLAWHLCRKDAAGSFNVPDDKRAAEALLAVHGRLHPETPLRGVDFKQVLQMNGRADVYVWFRKFDVRRTLVRLWHQRS